MSVALHGQFEAQKAEILTNLADWRFNKSFTRRKDSQADKRSKLDALIVWIAANAALADALRPLLYQLEIETGADAVQQVGKDPSQFNPLDPAIIAAAKAQADKAAASVDAETEKQLRAELGQGIDAGESVTELSARVEKVMGSALTMRTGRISRTETYRAMGNADVLAWRQAGNVTAKEWYTAEDERVCAFCASLDLTLVGLSDSFATEGSTITAGGQTMNVSYGDIGSPPLHPNCRCVVLPVTL